MPNSAGYDQLTACRPATPGLVLPPDRPENSPGGPKGGPGAGAEPRGDGEDGCPDGWVQTEMGYIRSEELAKFLDDSGNESIGDYLDSLANSPKKSSDIPADRGIKCSPRWISAVCSKGHALKKRIFCQRETCPTCGTSGSVAHDRRVARWMRDIQEGIKVGYLVATLPMQMRDFFKTKEALSDAQDYWKDQLREMGHCRGRSRWHFTGDKDCKKYHPHLNILFETDGFFSAEKLRYIREGWRQWLEDRCGISIPEAVLNYHYSSDRNKIVHWIRYVCRPTRLNLPWDLNEKLYRYRNDRWWGKWPEAEKTDEFCLCPACKEVGVRTRLPGWVYEGREVDLEGYRQLDPVTWVSDGPERSPGGEAG